MEIEASAQALASEPISEAPVMTETDELAKVWDDHQETPEPDETPDPEPVEAETPDEPVEEPAEAEQPEPVEAAPTELPKAVRDVWGEVPESAREAYLNSYRELGTKLREQGRQIQGIAPIRDVLSQAVQELPALADMKPEQAAAEIMQLAKVSNDFSTRPVETMMGLIKKHGLEQHMAAALQGQNTAPQANESAALKQEIARLHRQVQQLSDPDTWAERVTQVTQQTTVQNEVNQFAATAEHWGAVEPHMPNLIAVAKAKLGDGASAKDVLSLAYEQAVSLFVPEAKATPAPAPDQAATVADPEKTQAALKAKSVNVSGTSNGKSRPLTEEQELAKVWDKMQSN